MTDRLPQFVTDQTERRPEATAIVSGAERLSYATVETQSNRLARLLKEAGCRPGDRVCWIGPKAPMAIVSLLGIYKAGAIYVPLDPSGPVPRLERMIHICRPRLILAAGATAGRLQALAGADGASGAAIGWMDATAIEEQGVTPRFRLADLDSQAAGPVAPVTGGSDPAHILFTSGSTGLPKGVVVSHDNVRAFIAWAVRHFGIGPDDRQSCHSPLHFDLSIFDIFGTFAAGAELHIPPPPLNALPHLMAQFIRASGLTQWFSVPSLLSYLASFDVVRRHDFPALRRLLWCGDVLPTRVVAYWMVRLPHVRFTNLYGPTETTIASSHYTVPDVPRDLGTPIPIGTACAGEDLLVLDGERRPLPPGETGDLYIRGDGVCLGYWDNPEATRAAFLPDPESSDPTATIYRTGDLAWRGRDGLVHFAGRTDSQIKSRGHRIELGEVEAAVNALSCLREGAVVAIPTGAFDGVAICCAYTPRPQASITPGRLRQELGRLLPRYMLPSRWLAFDTLPHTSNGKLDRRQLREAFQREAVPAS